MEGVLGDGEDVLGGGGRQEAWTELIAEVHPLAVSLCRHRLNDRSPATEDICHDVATQTLERLQRDDYAALRRYRETRAEYPKLRFESWLRAVVANVCVDHLRKLPGHQRIRDGKGRRHAIKQAVALDDELGTNDDLRRHVEVRRVIAWLCDAEFPSDQRQALALWLRGHDAHEISTAMGLPSSAHATRLLRAGRQRLRRRFEDRS